MGSYLVSPSDLGFQSYSSALLISSIVESHNVSVHPVCPDHPEFRFASRPRPIRPVIVSVRARDKGDAVEEVEDMVVTVAMADPWV